MLVTLKTLQQQTFKLEIDDAATIAELKQKIEQEKGSAFPVGGQRLIYQGTLCIEVPLLGSSWTTVYLKMIGCVWGRKVIITVLSLYSYLEASSEDNNN
jgi:hypothetical protein